jgi:hypothetical protein
MVTVVTTDMAITVVTTDMVITVVTTDMVIMAVTTDMVIMAVTTDMVIMAVTMVIMATIMAITAIITAITTTMAIIIMAVAGGTDAGGVMASARAGHGRPLAMFGFAGTEHLTKARAAAQNGPPLGRELFERGVNVKRVHSPKLAAGSSNLYTSLVLPQRRETLHMRGRPNGSDMRQPGGLSPHLYKKGALNRLCSSGSYRRFGR